MERKWEHNGTASQLFIDFKEAYQSVAIEVLYNVLTELHKHLKLSRPTEGCSNVGYSNVSIDRAFVS